MMLLLSTSCVNRVIFNICFRDENIRKRNCQRIMLCLDGFIFCHCCVLDFRLSPCSECCMLSSG